MRQETRQAKQPVRVTIDLGDGCRATYGRMSGKVILISTEVPPSAAYDGVSNERFIGRNRLINAKRKAREHFAALRAATIQAKAPPSPPSKPPRSTVRAEPFNKWLGRNASPDIPSNDPRRFQTKVPEAQASDYLSHVPLDTTSEELVKGARSVRARKSHKTRRAREDRAIAAAKRKQEKEALALEKARQQELPF
ncbi:MAG: hypothetical protein P4M11_09535 [Candidatus Pacebacteria bacterium]|nr:hypothetical protein [Candidatus Paceibacterota bacterium]